MRAPSRSGDRTIRLLSEVADGSAALDPVLARELDHDLRFQAELVQYRKLLRALRSLRDEITDPGVDLLIEIGAALDGASTHGSVRSIVGGRRSAYLGGLAAATAAGLGGAFVIARRRHRFAA